jgi:hypothetical protein
LENVFQARLAELDLGADAAEPRFELMPKPTWSLEQKGSESTEDPNTERIERSGDTHPEPRRARDKEHLKFVAGHPCLVCGRRPADPHHL